MQDYYLPVGRGIPSIPGRKEIPWHKDNDARFSVIERAASDLPEELELTQIVVFSGHSVRLSDPEACGDGMNPYGWSPDKEQRVWHDWVPYVLIDILVQDIQGGRTTSEDELYRLTQEEVVSRKRVRDEESDARELANGVWASVQNLKLPENKVILAKRLVANWFWGSTMWWGVHRRIRSHSAQDWRKPPTTGVPEVDQRAQAIFERLQARHLDPNWPRQRPVMVVEKTAIPPSKKEETEDDSTAVEVETDPRWGALDGLQL